MTVELKYEVTTESESYGSECTTEQARVIAGYIEDKIYEYADEQGYTLFVDIVSHSRAVNPYYEWEPEHAAWEDINWHVENNWVDWAGEALNRMEDR